MAIVRENENSHFFVARPLFRRLVDILRSEKVSVLVRLGVSVEVGKIWLLVYL